MWFPMEAVVVSMLICLPIYLLMSCLKGIGEKGKKFFRKFSLGMAVATIAGAATIKIEKVYFEPEITNTYEQVWTPIEEGIMQSTPVHRTYRATQESSCVWTSVTTWRWTAPERSTVEVEGVNCSQLRTKHLLEGLNHD